MEPSSVSHFVNDITSSPLFPAAPTEDEAGHTERESFISSSPVTYSGSILCEVPKTVSREVNSVKDALAAEIKQLQNEQGDCIERLAILAWQAQKWKHSVAKKLTQFDKFQQNLRNESANLVQTLSEVCITSDAISRHVKSLNASQVSIQRSVSLVEAIMEVRELSATVGKSLMMGEYEGAASALTHYHRLMDSSEFAPTADDKATSLSTSHGSSFVGHKSIPSLLLNRLEPQEAAATTASKMGMPLNTASSPPTDSWNAQLLMLLKSNDKDALNALEDSEKQLVLIVKREFEKAISQGDRSNISRFAKLLYPLGLQDEGMILYIRYIRDLLSDQCASNFRELLDPFKGAKEQTEFIRASFADILTKVFVSVADIIQEHKESIEVEFGFLNFILFCRGLQEEVDLQGIRILDKFYDDRHKILLLKLDDLQNRIDLRQMNKVLDELVVLSKRCQQFDKYLRNCSKKIVDLLPKDSEFMKHLLRKDETVYNSNDGLFQLSLLNKRMQELMGFYVSLEHVHISRAIKHAAEVTDEVLWNDSEQQCSTMVEDLFFIFEGSIFRAIRSGDVYAACAVVNHVISFLSLEVRNYLESKAKRSKEYYADYVQKLSSLNEFVMANLLPEALKRSLEARGSIGSTYSWCHAVNNIQASIECIEILNQKCDNEFSEHYSIQETDSEEDTNVSLSTSEKREISTKDSKSFRMMFLHTLSNLESAKVDLEAFHGRCCKLTLSILKVHIFPFLVPLQSMNHNISEEEYADYQINDPFVKQFGNALKEFCSHLRTYYSHKSMNLCIQFLAEKVSKAIHATVLQKSFSLLGGMQFDADIRKLIALFGTYAEKSIRSKFTSIIEVTDLLSLSTLQEFPDLWGSITGKNWKLTPSEIKQVLSCRVDFSKENIHAFL
ncbi:hypothetical protein IE077_002535 [Cardiosporidium cionae]|uniref:Conserved oligomeric Golgi complex subunit 4 n=1 Tax=Cardiosporidium cionae TaxID=476202 RepID=A0ABQ7JFL2_9APIC|nr:hypothetical protein IE077_002535 [Cardiosporidium cionae]|eukprot:KAF8822811.1 hypothetical protein IE077_002535 [Cardiosporidium cionae]